MSIPSTPLNLYGSGPTYLLGDSVPPLRKTCADSVLVCFGGPEAVIVRPDFSRN